MKKYFYLEESPYMKTYQAIYLNHGNFPFEGKIYGSFNLMPARLCRSQSRNYVCREMHQYLIIVRSIFVIRIMTDRVIA